MLDRLSAQLLGKESTANGRRENFRFAPTGRMTNTFLMPGHKTPQEIIRATEHGLYAKTIGNGRVNPSTGIFSFVVKEGYEIKEGSIAGPVAGAIISGRCDSLLSAIDMIGNDFELTGTMCHGRSGWIPVGIGQPTIRIRALEVQPY